MTEVIRAAGDRALLVAPTGGIADLAAALRNRDVPGVEDVLPAAETLLVTLDSPNDAERVRRALGELLEEAADDVSRGTLSRNDFPEPLVIPVRYDGVDLDDVARLLNLSTAEVVAAHTSTTWHCGFVGFAPGFGYLESADHRLTVPRRDQARTAIPAGAVALAGGYTAVYPRSTPGGWRLIGHTDLRMWDVDRDPPALIQAGSAVRFVEADA
ncbi:allophanate hydrolase subunit 1 [Nocardia sp. XZ_19_385]|uniref:5-oxoprolinase subunit B family protein n=1 Tax=Nocardia sp. XZ_19_385 TaxID=2769488 RepID=UPI00188FE84E|nr:allophanate hydrolase subunit 1 [Nocardia sp. XZ_19_385]